MMTIIKNSPNALLILLLLVFTSTLFAQSDKSKRKSLPVVESKTIGDLTITVDFSSPSVNGREIWGSLVPYDRVWRTGANEATTISFSKNVTIDGQEIAAGTYALFTIPDKSMDWIVIFNTEEEQWGAYKYNDQNDALRIKVQAEKKPELIENLLFTIDENGKVTMAWEYLRVSFDVI